MLVDPQLCSQNYILSIISEGAPTDRVEPGVYLIDHFNFDMRLSRDGGNLREDDEWRGHSDYLFAWDDPANRLPLDAPFYGVCDSIAQFMGKYGEALKNDPRAFCVSFTRIGKAEQPASGGWRWHKWGPYVGDGEPLYEYLYNEPHFDEVFVFHIFVKRAAAT